MSYDIDGKGTKLNISKVLIDYQLQNILINMVLIILKLLKSKVILLLGKINTILNIYTLTNCCGLIILKIA